MNTITQTSFDNINGFDVVHCYGSLNLKLIHSLFFITVNVDSDDEYPASVSYLQYTVLVTCICTEHMYKNF